MRYDRKEIMLRSWELVREGYSRSDALKLAWAEARLLQKRMRDQWRKESLEWFRFQFSREAQSLREERRDKEEIFIF